MFWKCARTGECCGFPCFRILNVVGLVVAVIVALQYIEGRRLVLVVVLALLAVCSALFFKF